MDEDKYNIREKKQLTVLWTALIKQLSPNNTTQRALSLINTCKAKTNNKDRKKNGKCTNITNYRNRVGMSTGTILHWPPPYTVSHFSSASIMHNCWRNLSKLTKQRLYQILVYQNNLLLSSFTFSCCVSIIFCSAFFMLLLTNWTSGRG